MNINTKSCSKSELKRQHFNMKKSRRDGLCLRIHHTATSQKLHPLNVVRFHQAAFNSPGTQLAVSNHNGEIFIVDFHLEKFWYVCSVIGITALKFYERDKLFVGTLNGAIEIIDVMSEAKEAELIGHDEAVVDFVFSGDGYCMSWSHGEAIMWDVERRKNVRMLEANNGVGIKQVAFVPSLNDVFICFENDSMQIFNRCSLQPMAQFSDRSKVSIKCVAFTENGKALITSGHTNTLTVYLTSTLTTHQTITLPTDVRSVRKIEFIPRPYDNGANKILAALSSQGTVYFVNIENEQILRKIAVETEIQRFSVCPSGKRIACVMSSSDVQIYDLVYLLNKTAKSVPSTHSVRSKKREVYRKKMKEVLDVDKLRAILKEYGEYPELYRKVIWTNMLHLPSDKSQYEAIIKKRYDNSFSDLEQIYPLVNSQDLRNLKRTLNSLVSWCPFFNEVDFLPIFIYPFIRVFKNDPVLTFEALTAIIMNYCQYWFEYYPLPPLNILGMIENLLIEHDPLLMMYFSEKRVISKIYALPLLQSAFSEVLMSNEWLILWDHIISNEPDFYLHAVVAYSITNRLTLMSLKSYEDFVRFFTTQSNIDLRRFINRIYKLSSVTSGKNNPKQYLDLFKEMENGRYYKFTGYPKAHSELSKLNELKKERLTLADGEKELLRKQSEEIERLKDVQKENEELSRLSDLQLLYQKRIIDEHAEIIKQRETLDKLNLQLTRSSSSGSQKTDTSVKDSSSSITTKNFRSKSMDGSNTKKFKDKLIRSYVDLLAHKIRIEQLNGEGMELQETYLSLCQRLDEAKIALIEPSYLKQLTVKTGLETIDVLIGRVETELVQPEKGGNIKAQMLVKQTKEVSDEINRLIELFLNT